MPADINQPVGRDAGQCQLRCSDSSVDIDKYRRFAPCRYRGPSGRARFPANRKSAVRKRGPIERFVENQRPGIRPCGLVRVPAGSCGKIRTPAGSRRMVDRRTGSSVSRFGPVQTGANSCELAGRQLSGISGGLRVQGPVIRDFRITGDRVMTGWSHRCQSSL